ncbi:cytoskeleton-associated 2-like [Pelobates cultripes]|uniref:Cytoskeleton-associated 2-like n=1 Tax=Pelobates cultripes TaxID=61616 RepID=A0AAD1RN01_PELCU|nr:cytoskeleton-associated 2-like [Pelobates cultripes]
MITVYQWGKEKKKKNTDSHSDWSVRKPAVTVGSARESGVRVIMEGNKPLTAQEQLKQKLLEYLAVKGKLKPQNNPKHYLKDTTNLQNKPQARSSKPTQDTKLVFQGQKVKQASNITVQQRPKAAPQKNLKIIKQPGGAKLHTGTIPTKIIQTDTRIDQQKNDVDCKTQKNKAAAVSLPTNCAKELDVEEEASQGILEADIKEGSVNVDADNREISPINIETGHDDNASNVKQNRQQTHRIIQLKSSANHMRKKTENSSRVALTLRNPSNTKQTSSWNIPKSAPLATNTQKTLNKPTVKAQSGNTCTVSRGSQLASRPIVGTYKIVSSRSELLNPKITNCVSKATGSVCAIKQNHVNTSTNLKGSSINGPRQPKLTTVTQTALNKERFNSLSKQSAKTQVSKPVCRTLPTKLQTKSSATCIKPWFKARGETVSSRSQTQNSRTVRAKDNGHPETASNVTHKPCVTPKMATEDRKKQLEEWLSTKGKTYKRPPMSVTVKKTVKSKKRDIHNSSLWAEIEEEEELLHLSERINSTLSECLALIHQGVPSEDIHATLDKIPQAKKFARFWVCKARLLERDGIFDVIELYEKAVKFGASPIDELRDVVFDILKSTNKKPKVVRFQTDLAIESHGDEPVECCNNQNRTSTKINRVSTPFKAVATSEHGSAIKFQVVSSKKKEPASQEWKFLTPIRRSLRINQAMSCYPETLKEHDTVVASLTELLDTADTDAYLYTRNEALPEEADLHLLELMIKQDSTEQSEGPV